MFRLIIDLFVGAVSGTIAANLMGIDSSNMVRNAVLGLVGGIAFSFVGGLIGIGGTNIIGHIICAVIGACLIVYLYRRFIEK